jgi:hypothetical protein
MSVAESTEIFAPIDQFGCATAWAGVAAAIICDEAVRNGPPLAVKIILATSSLRLPPRHCESDGLARFDRGHDRLEAGASNDRGDDELGGA